MLILFLTTHPVHQIFKQVNPSKLLINPLLNYTIYQLLILLIKTIKKILQHLVIQQIIMIKINHMKKMN